MIKKISSLLLLSIVSFCFAADDISGFWKSLDKKGRPQCVFAIYQHEGNYYGKIIGTYDDDGKMRDTIYEPTKQSEGVIGAPYTCGLDIVHGLIDTGPRFAGKIIDPSKGKTYKCEMWRENESLILRGKLFIFGKNITWHPVTEQDFPENFELPDLSSFTPQVPIPN